MRVAEYELNQMGKAEFEPISRMRNSAPYSKDKPKIWQCEIGGKKKSNIFVVIQLDMIY